MSCQNSIFSFTNLLLNGGKDEKDWITLLKDIESEEDTTEFIKNIQNDITTNSNNELFFDIIDFIVDNCSDKTIKLLAEDNFLNDFISPLKNNVIVQVQMKIIYLIQKWSNKVNYPNFKNKYEFLKSNGIVFPQSDFKMDTYNKYVKNPININQNNNNMNNPSNDLFPKSNDNPNDLFPKSNNNPNDLFPKSNNDPNDLFPKSNNNPNDLFPKSNNNPNDLFPKSNSEDLFPKNQNDNLFPKNNSNDLFPKNNSENLFSNNNINNNNLFPGNNNNNIFPKNDNQEENTQFHDINQFDINQINDGNNFPPQNNNQAFNNNNNPFENINNNQSNKNNQFNYNNPFGDNNNSQFSNNSFQNNNQFSQNPYMNQFGNPYVQNQSNNSKSLGMNMNQFGNNNNFGMNQNNFNNPQQLSYSYNDIFNDNSKIDNPYMNQNNSFNDNNFGNSYMNSNNYNYSTNNFSGGDILNQPELIKKNWREKLSTYNNYINQGKFTYNSEKLKEGVNEIIDNLTPMENLIAKFSMMNDNQARRDMVNIRNDMEQTLYRYDNLMKGKKVEPFHSAFDGNSRRYEFNPKTFYSKSNYTGYNSFDHESKLETTMDKIKSGVFKIGSVIKEKTIDGYDFIKEKITGEETNRRNNNNQYYSYGIGNNNNQNQTNTYSNYNNNNNNYGGGYGQQNTYSNYHNY